MVMLSNLRGWNSRYAALVLGLIVASSGDVLLVNSTGLNDGTTRTGSLLQPHVYCKMHDVFPNLTGNVNQAAAAALPKYCDSVDLYDSGIGDGGASSIAEALKGNTQLQSLDLSSNNIGDVGAVALANALKTNTALESLSLSYNNIGTNGAKAMAEALTTNTGLAMLFLEGCNGIGDTGAIAITSALAVDNTKTALTFLGLSSNSISKRGRYKIAKASRVLCTRTGASLETCTVLSTSTSTSTSRACVCVCV